MIPIRRLSITLLFSASILAFPLAGSPLDHTHQFFDQPCDQEGVKEPFMRGMHHYDKECKLAIPLLEEAAGLCPEPEAPLSFSSQGFLKRSYLPFYFLGDCHYILKDLPNALRNFYLSSCVGEPRRDKDTTKTLFKQTAECRSGLEKSRQPDQHPPEFSEGLKRASDRNWGKTANSMWDALQIEPDDGEMKPSGRWPDPYLPGLRLANALVELGCTREACAQYDRFEFKDFLAKGNAKKFQTERQIMDKLNAKCTGPNRGRSAPNETCQRWRCWVAEGRP